MTFVPLVPSLILGIASFLLSALVLACHVLPLFRSGISFPYSSFLARAVIQLSSSDCSYIWLSCFDFVAVTAFLIQVVWQYAQGTTLATAVKYGGSAACFWIAMASRPSFFLVILSIKVLQVRLRRPISYGTRCIYIWAPTIGLVVTGAVTAALLAEYGFTSLFGGIASYLSITSILSTCLFLSLVRSFVLTVRRLDRQNDTFSWIDNIARKRRQSFDTSDIQALKGGPSWITSVEGSIRRSLSAWSFTTNDTNHIGRRHVSSHSFPLSLHSQITISTLSESLAPIDPSPDRVPPVPPLPSPYKRPAPVDIPRNASLSDSTNSWLTSDSDARETMSSFSFPTTHYSRSVRGSKQVENLSKLSTTSFRPATVHTQHSNHSSSTRATTRVGTNVSPEILSIKWPQAFIWIASIWVPYALAMPYIISSNSGRNDPTVAAAIMFMLSMIIPAPIFLVSVLFKLPLPIHPAYTSKPSKKHVTFASKSSTVLPLHHRASELRIRGKSSSLIVTEGRRSGDVWIDRGQAIDGLSKTGRLVSMLVPNPKLSVLPHHSSDDFNTLDVQPSSETPAKSYSIQAYTLSDKDVDEIATVPREVGLVIPDSFPAPYSEQNKSADEDTPWVTSVPVPQPLSRSYLPHLQASKEPISPPPSIPLPPIPLCTNEEGPIPLRRLNTCGLENATSSEFLGPWGLQEANPNNALAALHTPRRYIANSDILGSISRGRSGSLSSIVTTPDDHSTPHLKGHPRHLKHQRSCSFPVMPPPIAARSNDTIFLDDQTEPTDQHVPPGTCLVQDNTHHPYPDPLAHTTIITRDDSSTSCEQKPYNPPDSSTRRKHSKRRYTPLESAQRARNTRHRAHRPKDSKTLYTPRQRRSEESALSITPPEDAANEVPATIVSSVEYLPAINRLSTILTDHASRLMEISEVKNTDRSPFAPRPNKTTLSGLRGIKQDIKGTKRQATHKPEKENTGDSQVSFLAPLERTASARQRSLLIRSQGLPTVVVRPPSASSAGDTVSMFWNEVL
ncbi:hypothetical protein FRB91_000147 [Serendipita sp. 411]|nr:hypothetical protein FRC19_006229 [Serendipita sp. 401]KAG8860951.1 hypothetical protein FRB91_000147 [Serendipita sp. 411]KAG9054502.1 hypothetical protein FS842_004959 [Serendipita sp. 407]